MTLGAVLLFAGVVRVQYRPSAGRTRYVNLCISSGAALLFAVGVRVTVPAISRSFSRREIFVLQFGRSYRLLGLYEYNIGNRRTSDIQNFCLNIVWFDRLLVLYEYSTGHWQD